MFYKLRGKGGHPRRFSSLLALMICLSLVLSPVSVLADTILPEPTPAAAGDRPAVTPDTSWYNEEDTEFTLTTTEQLYGLAQLVNEGNSFYQKTIKLGNDIDLSVVAGNDAQQQNQLPENDILPVEEDSQEDEKNEETPTITEDEKTEETPTITEDEKTEETPAVTEDEKTEETPIVTEDEKTEETPIVTEDEKTEENPTAVSYTHLDVYKRQHFGRLCGGLRGG